mgnify:CR=1 FL=1
MSVTDININQISPLISNEMFKNIFNEINVIIKKICIENNLNPEDVIAKHTSDISKLGLKYGIKKRNKRKLNKNEQCMGRKIDGKQCTRGRRPNCEFCKSHENKLAHGRIDEPYQNKESIKRGRKKKNKVIDYVSTSLEIIDGKHYLVDDNNYVFSYNINNPEFIGIKRNNTIEKYEAVV